MSNAAPQVPMLTPGEYVPWFRGPVYRGRPDWSFYSAGGMNCLMFFMGSAQYPQVRAALDAILARRDLFDGRSAAFFGVTIAPNDANDLALPGAADPGIRYFLDFDREVSRAFGATVPDREVYRPHILVLDRALRVVGGYSLADVDHALAVVAADPSHDRQDWAPVVAVPDLLEPDLCKALIDVYENHGGQASGFMREIDGKTQIVTDNSFKQRRDAPIDSAELRGALLARIRRRLVPAIKRNFQFEATRIERYIVAAYDAGAGHFSPHRDNTTKGTAHRRFAVSINLNADFDGGDLRFPEYGMRTYRPAPGGAVVFSCSLLHEATPVTRGRRYACLPFLYDDSAAKIREANNEFLAEGVGHYMSGPPEREDGKDKAA